MSASDAGFGRCVRCGKPLPDGARFYADDYCSTGCARAASGVSDLDERRRLGVPSGWVYGSSAYFAELFGIDRTQFFRRRLAQTSAQESLGNFIPLPRLGWFTTEPLSLQAALQRKRDQDEQAKLKSNANLPSVTDQSSGSNR